MEQLREDDFLNLDVEYVINVMHVLCVLVIQWRLNVLKVINSTHKLQDAINGAERGQLKHLRKLSIQSGIEWLTSIALYQIAFNLVQYFVINILAKSALPECQVFPNLVCFYLLEEVYIVCCFIYSFNFRASESIFDFLILVLDLIQLLR